MPKSKHRKNQKQKSKARTERLTAQKRSFNKKMEVEFKKYMEEMENKDLSIEEVKPEQKESQMSHSYMIKKTLMNRHIDKLQHVFMTDGNSQILEFADIRQAEHFVGVMNVNTDSGCIYEVITIKNNK